MLNIIKMDLYRMLKTKSMYVIWIVLAAILLITTSLSKTDYELLTEKDAMKQEQVTEPTVDNINVGMMVTLPTEPGEKVTVYDIFFANSQGKLYALLLVIFTVLFSTADISSGYITGSKRGLDTRVSLKSALAAEGFTGGARGATELNQWITSEKQELATVMERYGVEWLQKGTHEKHLSVLEFEKKERAKEVAELDSQKQEISSVVLQLGEAVSAKKQELQNVTIEKELAEEAT